jgi:two-component system sensor histidine kinase KdpD
MSETGRSDQTDAGRLGLTILDTVGALLLVAAVTIVLALLKQRFAISHVSMVYLVPVVVAAARWGLLPAVVAAIAGIAASAYFFYPPIYDLRVSDPRQLIDLPFFVLVAAVTAQLSNSLKRQAELARRRQKEIEELYAFSKSLATAHTEEGILAAIRSHIASVLGRDVVLIGAGDGGKGVPPAVLAAASERTGGTSREVPDLITRHAWLVRDLVPGRRTLPTIAVDLGPGEVGEMRERVEAVLSDAAVTLEQLDLASAVDDARVRAETELLREALLGSVSHELKTPLTSVLGAVSVISEAPAIRSDPAIGPLALTLRREAERLNDDIQDLLDASRIVSGGVHAKLEWTDATDIVRAAMERKRARLGGRVVAVSLAADLPLVYVDPVLTEQALGQILDNAAKFSPDGSNIGIAAAASGRAEVVVAVTDEGSGLLADELPRIWERFYRSPRVHALAQGSGLGLWIARAFVNASGGRIEAESPGANQGTTIRISLPAPAPPSTAEEGDD